MGYTILTGVWEEIDDELARQRRKHGPRCMEERDTWDAIPPLVEEVGEVAQAVTKWRDGEGNIGEADVRKELIHVAACCVAMIRHLDGKRMDAAELAQWRERSG